MPCTTSLLQFFQYPSVLAGERVIHACAGLGPSGLAGAGSLKSKTCMSSRSWYGILPTRCDNWHPTHERHSPVVSGVGGDRGEGLPLITDDHKLLGHADGPIPSDEVIIGRNLDRWTRTFILKGSDVAYKKTSGPPHPAPPPTSPVHRYRLHGSTIFYIFNVS